MEIGYLKFCRGPGLPCRSLHSKQATCIADLFSLPLTAVCKIWGLDVVRELEWADWAIRTPGSQVTLCGDIL